MNTSFEDFKKTISSTQDSELYKLYVEQYKTISDEETKKKTEDCNCKEKLIAHKYDFWKFFLGTFILGAAAAITTWIFKDYELQIQSRREDSASIQPYVQQYITLLEKDALKFDRAYYMAEFLSFTITEEKLKKGYENLRDTLKVRVSAQRDSLIQITNKVEKKNTELNNLIKATPSDTSSADVINKYKAEVIKLEKELKKLSEQKVEIVKEAQKNLEQLPVVIAKSENPEYEVIYDLDRYTGEGYLSQIISNIEVNVDAFKANRSIATFRISKDDETVGDAFDLKIGESKTLKTLNGNLIITIVLQDIAKFANRAYYHIQVQKKK